jgi:hypothetical protein
MGVERKETMGEIGEGALQGVFCSGRGERRKCGEKRVAF